MSGVVDAHEPEWEEADAKAWEANDPAFGGFTEKVWVVSGSPTYVTEIVVGVVRGEQATCSWRCLPRRNAIPHRL